MTAVDERFEPDAGVAEQCEALFSEVRTPLFRAVLPDLARLTPLPAGPAAGSWGRAGGAQT